MHELFLPKTLMVSAVFEIDFWWKRHSFFDPLLWSIVCGDFTRFVAEGRVRRYGCDIC